MSKILIAVLVAALPSVASAWDYCDARQDEVWRGDTGEVAFIDGSRIAFTDTRGVKTIYETYGVGVGLMAEALVTASGENAGAIWWMWDGLDEAPDFNLTPDLDLGDPDYFDWNGVEFRFAGRRQ
jgi:hypothetical protein